MSFFEAVYEAVKSIPRGKVASYGRVAAMAGSPRAARGVGRALHVNPDPGTIPCHRVVTQDGRASRAFAFGGINVQIERLLEEGVVFRPDGTVDMKKSALV